MPNKGIFAKKLVFNRKHHKRKWTITTTRNQLSFARFFEKTVKRIVLQNTTNARHALRGKHIVGDDNGVVLTEIKGQSIGVQQKTQREYK